tara:strand:+ start:488 stop:721 length:234 start_codon:yes stop_codon:yes gene_type:complete
MGRIPKIAIFSILSNTILFLFVILTIQNSKITKKIDFLTFQTVPLPISFIISSSFIIGSISGSLLTSQIKKGNTKLY